MYVIIVKIVSEWASKRPGERVWASINMWNVDVTLNASIRLKAIVMMCKDIHTHRFNWAYGYTNPSIWLFGYVYKILDVSILAVVNVT